MFVFAIVAFIIIATGFNQFYKLTTRTMKNASAQTVGLQLLAGITCLIFIPFFEFKFPSNPWTYLLLGISCIFYALNNRILASVRKNLEASVIGILQQSYTVLMTLAGFILFNEKITLLKVAGISLIIGGNVLVFWQRKKTENSKYVLYGLLAYACNAAAGLIDVGYSGEFNLPFYTAFLYFIPAFFIAIGSKVHFADIISEYKRSDKKFYLLTSFCWGMQYLVKLIAYSMSEVSIVAPLSSLVIFSNIAVGYVWLKEKDNLVKKITAAILAVVGIVLISI